MKYTGYIKFGKKLEAQFNNNDEWCKIGMEMDGYSLHNIKTNMVTFMHNVTGEKFIIPYQD